MRGALPGFRDPVTPARLLDLARRPEVEARLVLEKGGARPWEVVPGPLAAARLRALPPRRWTVLVHAVDAHVPAVARLRHRFDFVPRWRLDDVMVSLAAPLGSVGPHVDAYDVFLLQGRGRRRWGIARRFDPALRAGLDLGVLRRFRPEREWVLDPGDMLYLPPGVAHHGVALEECLTYSIGFRAPAQAALAAGFLARVVQGLDRSRLYADPGLAPTAEPGRIDARALRGLRRMVEGALRPLHGPEFEQFVGEHLTEPRGEARRRGRRLPATRLRRALAAGAVLAPPPGTRLAYVRGGAGAPALFADGRAWEVPQGLAGVLPLLAGREPLGASALAPHLRRPGLFAFLARLLSGGVLRLSGGGAGRRGRGGSRPARGSRPRGGRR